MSKEFACATCGRDLMYEIPRGILRWDRSTDTRVFCSGPCITESSPPDDCRVFRPQTDEPIRVYDL